jgi:hypothetical protein
MNALNVYAVSRQNTYTGELERDGLERRDPVDAAPHCATVEECHPQAVEGVDCFGSRAASLSNRQIADGITQAMSP